MALKPAMHGRDHCPTGSDPIPAACLAGGNIPWVRRRKTSAQTIDFGGDELLTFNSDVGSVSPDWNDYFTIISSTVIRLDVKAYVLMSCQMQWGATFTDDRMLELNDGFSWGTGWLYRGNSAFSSPSHTFTHAHRYEAAATFSVEAALSGSTNRDIDVGYFEIAVIGTWDGTAPSDVEE